MKKTECKHQWIHTTIKARSMNERDKTIYIWLIHKCKKCGIETNGVRLDEK